MELHTVGFMATEPRMVTLLGAENVEGVTGAAAIETAAFR
jgi:hypothetical protein